MQLTSISYYTHQGKRDFQEDHWSCGLNYLLVSDGVGGLAKGDKASEIVSSVTKSFLTNNPPGGHDIPAWAQNLTSAILQTLWEQVRENPESHGLGATLAMVVQVEDQIYAIHIGDSRIYHFAADGTIKWVSKDHSFVQELIDAGIITPEQATDHPKRNVITRILQGKKDHQVKASVTQLKSVDNGDIIMVCSDGVLESWTNEGLSTLVSRMADTWKIICEIKKHCTEHSSDNNTAVVARIS